jgi:hypothetical protein
LELIAYPNPTDGKLTLKLSNGESYEGAVEVYDMAGRLVKKVVAKSSAEIQLSGLVQGHYMLKTELGMLLIKKD